MCLLCMNRMVSAEHLLSFEESGICYLLDREYLCDQPPIKTLGTEFVMRVLDKRFTCRVLPVCCQRFHPV